MENIILEDQMMGKPPQPAQWAWITQRQETDGKSASIWKFGFLAPDGGEVRVTFHQIQQPTSDQQAPPQADQSQNQMGMMGGDSSGQGIVPQGEPNPDQTGDGVFYATFFSNRNPEHFMKWDTSLSHEDSLTVWLTVTHGLVDFLRKAKPKNLILDDLGNGKLKMVLRSVSMDVVATDPEYTLELTKKHEYRSFYQIKKGASPSAFDQVIAGHPNEGDTQAPVPPSPGVAPIKDKAPDDSVEANNGIAKDDNNGIAQDNSMATSADSPQNGQGAGDPPQAPLEPVQPKETINKKGMTVEIGRDYSIAVKDKSNNVVDRFRGKNPLDILRWINLKGYGSNRMKVVDKETPSGVIAKTRNAEGMADDDQQSNLKTEQHIFSVNGNKVILHAVLSAKRAAAMNYVVNADTVRCTMESVEFEFVSDKDMNFKRALVEIALKQSLAEWPGRGRSRYANPGSALRTATKNNPRVHPCPTCKQENKLTPADKAKGYQCDDCARREEGVGY